MTPISLKEPSGRYLQPAERDDIAFFHALGHGVRDIARRLGRSPSTISRELRNNRSVRDRQYRAVLAQSKVEERRRRPKPSKLARQPALAEVVQQMLNKRFSPEQICARLPLLFPDDPLMRISPETLYRSLYVQGRGGLTVEVKKALRSGRAVRKPRTRTSKASIKGQILDKVLISERPAEADDRAVPGHWEGDLILGAGNQSAIGTLVERTSRTVLLMRFGQRHDAVALRDAIQLAVAKLPAQLWRSLTWDQGTEMHKHQQITELTGLAVYFCDPGSPWQRGSNENTNGLLRQYFPKGSDLSRHTQDDLDAVAAELNERPRKTLGWDTPAERLIAILEGDPPTGVATTT